MPLVLRIVSTRGIYLSSAQAVLYISIVRLSLARLLMFWVAFAKFLGAFFVPVGRVARFLLSRERGVSHNKKKMTREGILVGSPNVLEFTFMEIV